MNDQQEKKSRVRRENYIQIQGWMLTDLKLKGNELLVYAIIYGFSQLEHQVFNGSLQYLMDWTGASRRTIINVLNSLQDKGLLEKTEELKNNVKFCSYNAIIDFSWNDKICTRGAKIAPPHAEFAPPRAETAPNNLVNNIADNIESDKRDKFDKTDKLGEFDNSTDELTNFKLEKEKQKIEKHNQEIAKAYLNPTALTKMLIKEGYIAKDDPYIKDYNDFLIDLTEQYDFEQVRNSISYFFAQIRGRRDEIGNRLAYFKSSMEQGLKAANIDWDNIYSLAGGK